MSKANTVKLNGERLEVIKLQLFPFSLRGVAATWFDSLLVGSMNNWEELVEAYMSIFFPQALTYERRGEIIVVTPQIFGGHFIFYFYFFIQEFNVLLFYIPKI